MSNADNTSNTAKRERGTGLGTEQNLVQLKIDSVNWTVLWKNPQTGEFWKEYFPHSEMHGGGPGEFVKITEAQAKSEFGSW